MPPKARHIIGFPRTAPNLEVKRAENAKQIGKRPGPVVVTSGHATEPHQLLPAISEPVAIGGQLRNLESALSQVMLVPIATEAGAIAVGREMHQRCKGRGQTQL